MKNILKYLFLTLLSLSMFTGCQNKKIKALIVTGQNNHNWEESHVILGKILDNSGSFIVETVISPAEGEDMELFVPNFEAYDVIVLDYTGDDWSKKTQTAFENYVKNGGGVVVYHAANNAFPNWEAFNKICGLGGWNGRNEKSGPYVYYNRNDDLIRDDREGRGGSHGPQHEFIVELREPEHPIVRGLPKRWMHSKDELYSELRGPAENMTILATAFADPKKKGTGRNEPVLMTLEYGKGRIFHTVIGHVGKEKDHYAAQCAGFIVTLQRGAEWAATGDVNQVMPLDLPNIAAPFILPSYKFYSTEDLFQRVRSFEYGKTQKFASLISNRIRIARGQSDKLLDYEKNIIIVLNSEATADCKNYLCRELSWMGSTQSIPVLKELANQDETADMAQFALARIQ